MIHEELRALYNHIDVLNGNIYDITQTYNVIRKDEMTTKQVTDINNLLVIVNKKWAKFIEKHNNEFKEE